MTPPTSSADWLRVWAAQMLWVAEQVSRAQQNLDRLRRGEL